LRPVELISYTVWGAAWFPDGWQGLKAFLDARELAGVELLISGTDDPAMRPPSGLATGVHLRLPRETDSPDRRSPAAVLAEQMRVACQLGAEYVVVHANELPRGTALLRELWEDDTSATHRIAGWVSQAYDLAGRPGMAVGLENAYGPGLRPDDPEGVAAFLNGLADGGMDAGLVLDVGHYAQHIALAGRWGGRAGTEGEVIAETRRLSQALHERAVRVAALHLHWPGPTVPPASALEEATTRYRRTPDEAERGRIVGELFETLDRHQPLSDPGVSALVAAVGPRYVVHEVAAMSLPELAGMLDTQCTALRGGKG